MIARKLGLKARDARMLMVRSEHWKLVHFGRDLPPQLFNLLDDPLELNDLGRDQGTAARSARDDLYGMAFEWMRERRNRIGMTDAAVNRRPSPAAAGGVKIGIW